MQKRSVRTLTALLLALLLVSCSAPNSSGAGQTSAAQTGTAAQSSPAQTEPEAAKAEEKNLPPLELEIMFAFNGVEYPQPNNPIQQAIEENTNTKLTMLAYPGATFTELLPAMIASDDLPMVVAYGASQIFMPYMINAYRAGIFWDMTDYIQEYPNLSGISKSIYDTFKIEGRYYGIPRERYLARGALGYRADWLENLGLPEPKTVDDLYKMWVAFTENDPDQNGAKDTYAVCMPPVAQLAVHLGAPDDWGYVDGKAVKAEFTEPYQEALDMMRNLYAIGGIHPEYAVHARAQYEALWTEGKSGSYYNINNFSQYKMTDEKAVIHVNGVFSSDKGTFTVGGTGHNGIISVSKKAVAGEETFRRVMGFFDKLGEPSMSNLLALGIEGENYSIEDGFIVKSEDNPYTLGSAYDSPIASAYSLARITHPLKGDYLLQREYEVPKENAPYATPLLFSGLISETASEIGSELDLILSDAKTQYIMGKIDLDQYKAQLDKWLTSGGNKIAEELAAEYVKRAGK